MPFFGLQFRTELVSGVVSERKHSYYFRRCTSVPAAGGNLPKTSHVSKQPKQVATSVSLKRQGGFFQL